MRIPLYYSVSGGEADRHIEDVGIPVQDVLGEQPGAGEEPTSEVDLDHQSDQGGPMIY
jgi:hypothetical protein